MFASNKVFLQFEKGYQRNNLTRDDLDDYLQRERIAFFNYLSNALHNLGGFETQMLYRNLVAESRGLSKSGRHLLSRLGYLVPETTYQRRVKLIIDSHDELIRS